MKIVKLNLMESFFCFDFSFEIELHRQPESSTSQRCKLLQCGDGDWPLPGIWDESEPGAGSSFGTGLLLRTFPESADDECTYYASSAATKFNNDAYDSSSSGRYDWELNASTHFAATCAPPRRHCYDCRGKVTNTPHGTPPASYICTCGPKPRTFPRAPTVNFHVDASVLWYWRASRLRASSNNNLIVIRKKYLALNDEIIISAFINHFKLKLYFLL